MSNRTPTESLLHEAGQRLVFVGKNEVELQPFELRALEPDEVLVQTSISLLSTGTETIVFSRRFDPGTHWDAWVRYPFFPGYASVGKVVAVGEAVDKLAVGQRVATRRGHTTHAHIKQENCWPIPPEVESEEAVWFALAKIAGHGVRAAHIGLGQNVAVIGAGPIGQMAVRWALIGGAATVLNIDISPQRLEMAALAGAVPVMADASKADEKVIQALGGKRPMAVIDSTGNSAVLKSALRMVETEGTVVLLGDTGTPTEQRLTGDVISRGLTLVGAHDGRNTDSWNNHIAARSFFEALRSGRFNLSRINTHYFDPHDCVEAYRVASQERQQTMGIIFDWTKFAPSGQEAPSSSTQAAKRSAQPVS